MRLHPVAAMAALAALSACSTLQRARTALVRAPSACVDQTVQVYFDALSADLTPEGRSVIETAAANLRACKVRGVEVVGLADAAGDPASNLALSQRRAQSVSQALAAAGLPAAEFRITAAGQAGARTPGGETEPVRRRVDVTLRASR